MRFRWRIFDPRLRCNVGIAERGTESVRDLDWPFVLLMQSRSARQPVHLSPMVCWFDLFQGRTEFHRAAAWYIFSYLHSMVHWLVSFLAVDIQCTRSAVLMDPAAGNQCTNPAILWELQESARSDIRGDQLTRRLGMSLVIWAARE